VKRMKKVVGMGIMEISVDMALLHISKAAMPIFSWIIFPWKRERSGR